jgi:hypothetical protein
MNLRSHKMLYGSDRPGATPTSQSALQTPSVGHFHTTVRYIGFNLFTHAGRFLGCETWIGGAKLCKLIAVGDSKGFITIGYHQ